MAFFKFKNIKISAVSSAVPTEIIRGGQFADSFGEEAVRKFQEGTGVKEFHKTSDHQTASDLCYVATEEIIQKKNLDRDDIGALVFVAHSTDYRRPATACVLHKRLGLNKDCVAFDVSLGCSAFVYGLNVVCSLMASSNIRKAFLLVGETLTKMTHPKDKSVAMLFGDAGASILLEKADDNAEIKGILKTDGSGYKAIIAPAGGFRNLCPPYQEFQWPDGNVRSLYNTIMKGEDVFSFTISDVPRTIKEFLKETETTVEDYDCFAFHQANQFISKILCKKLKIDSSKMPLCLDRYGNTSAAAIPLVLSDAYGEKENDSELNVLMCGFGVGLSWGVCSAKIDTRDIFPIVKTDHVFEEGVINTPDDL